MAEVSVLHLSVVHEQEFTVLYAAGEIDISTAPQLRELLEELTGNVILDLTDVLFLESQGLAVLTAAQKHLLEHRADLRLRNPKGSVRRALQFAGIHAWIDE
jgi:anti-sigma B factor antagonist